MKKLPEPIKQLLEPAVDERFARAVWSRIERPPARKAPVVWAVLLSSAVAWLLAFLYFDRPAPQLRPPAPGQARTFADGSRMALSAQAKVEVLQSDERAAVFLLAQGQLKLDVVPTGRRWAVDAGFARVEVLGTRFSVERTKDAVEVRVDRGVVLVTSALLQEGWVKLEAGKHVVVRRQAPKAKQVEPPPEPPVQPESLEQLPQPSKPAPVRPAAPKAVSKPPQPPKPPKPAEPLVAPAARLMAQADAHRALGASEKAIERLLVLIQQHPDAPEAPLAAFTVGRLQLGLGQQAKANAAFERALVLGLPKALEEAALLRLMEGYATTSTAHRQAAQRYLQRFPQGRAREKAKRALVERKRVPDTFFQSPP